MPLILAVEPDRKQADAVATLARSVLRSEVVVTDSADAAIAIMAKRVPDLLLTSLLLPPKDEARLAERLRELDAAGTYVQTLVIPMLAVSNKKASESKRRLWKSRGSNSAPDGCAPEVFAGQISEYLRRAAVESVSRGRAVKAELNPETSEAALAAIGHVASDARHAGQGALAQSPGAQSSHILAADAAGDATSAAALEAAAAKQLLADRQAPKRRSSPDPSPTAGASDLIKPGHAPMPPDIAPPQRIVAPAATGSSAASDRLNGQIPPKPQERVLPDPRPSSVSERLSRLAAPKPVVVAPEPPRTVVDRPPVAGTRRVLVPDPPRTPPEQRPDQVSALQPHPPVARRVESPAQVARPVVAASPAPAITNKPATAPSGAGNQSSTQRPADKVMQPAASAAESGPERSSARQKVVLGALDLGAFVEELTAARGNGTSGLPADEQNTPSTTPTATGPPPQKLQPVATQDQAPAVAEQTSPSGDEHASPDSAAEQSRGGRPPARRRAGQDDWGIFDPQQAGFAALFAKLEDITEPEDLG